MAVFKRLRKKLDNLFFGGDWTEIEHSKNSGITQNQSSIEGKDKDPKKEELEQWFDKQMNPEISEINVIDADEVGAKKTKRRTKTARVKNHLLEYGYIDSQTAIDRYNATRLSAIIFELRHKHNMFIETEDRAVKDKETGELTYCKYILKS